ncbi:MAG: 4-hydroxy-tetrahydrodipicolinate reductase [Limnochordaceae bacterium]|nr:4-hydroxy-tetrahydrodipicolinate reductase [Limnochordaceae bacterium]
MPVKVAVAGASGKVGREVVAAVVQHPDMQLVGALGRRSAGRDAGELAGIGQVGVLIERDVRRLLERASIDVLVDFTEAQAALEHAFTCIDAGIHLVVGTTGISRSELEDLDARCRQRGVGAVVSPNFAIGALLMMRLATLVAPYMPRCEIVEMHHETKLDAPSGTALRTAALIAEARGRAEGGAPDPVPIHSVRLPGLVAHQEVIFGLEGQTLTIRHDSTSRRSFVPGVLLAVQRVGALRGVHSLEEILFEQPPGALRH